MSQKNSKDSLLAPPSTCRRYCSISCDTTRLSEKVGRASSRARFHSAGTASQHGAIISPCRALANSQCRSVCNFSANDKVNLSRRIVSPLPAAMEFTAVTYFAIPRRLGCRRLLRRWHARSTMKEVAVCAMVLWDLDSWHRVRTAVEKGRNACRMEAKHGYARVVQRRKGLVTERHKPYPVPILACELPCRLPFYKGYSLFSGHCSSQSTADSPRDQSYDRPQLLLTKVLIKWSPRWAWHARSPFINQTAPQRARRLVQVQPSNSETSDVSWQKSEQAETFQSRYRRNS